MLPIEQLTVKRVADIDPGNLVLHRTNNTYTFALAVRAPDRPAPAVLLLNAGAAGQAPQFAWSNDYCLNFNCKPIFSWGGDVSAFSNATQVAPPVGHLAVQGTSHFISGNVSSSFGDPVYWDLTTGAPIAQLDYLSTLYVRKWTLGVLNSEQKLVPLMAFGQDL